MSTSVDTALERNPADRTPTPPLAMFIGDGAWSRGAGPSRTPTSFLSRARARTREG
jgi:hypothetical protein